MSNIFRKAALRNYSSVERLDREVSLTPLPSWIGVIAAMILIVAVIIWAFLGNIPEIETASGILTSGKGSLSVCTDVSGTLKYHVKPGADVKKGQTVAEIVPESGRPVEIVSPYNGSVSRLFYDEGSVAYIYDEILSLTPGCGSTAVFCMPLRKTIKLKEGMKVKLYTGSMSHSEKLDGEIIGLGRYACSAENVRRLIGNAAYSNNSGEPCSVLVCRILNEFSDDRYKLSGGKKLEIREGDPLKASIVVRNRTPMELFFDYLTGGEFHG